MAVIREADGTYTVKHAGEYVFNGTQTAAWKKQAEIRRSLPWAQQPVHIDPRAPSQRRFDR